MCFPYQTTLSGYFEKSFISLGHNLEEIRLRALENILSKLRNGIICNEDLIHHKELFVNLLQWFNHENPPKIGQVLKLLESLSKVRINTECGKNVHLQNIVVNNCAAMVYFSSEHIFLSKAWCCCIHLTIIRGCSILFYIETRFIR